MTTEQREAIIAHGKRLQATFRTAPGYDPLVLCNRLRRIELATSRAACDYCNTGNEAAWNRARACAAAQLMALLNYDYAKIPVIINGDPRGYALKIDEAWMRSHPDCRLPRDWGDYGIIAPEIGPDGR